MLDQNTDRMWYVIGAVIIGAAIILILNGTAPELFASVGETFKAKTEEVTGSVDKLTMTDGAMPNPYAKEARDLFQASPWDYDDFNYDGNTLLGFSDTGWDQYNAGERSIAIPDKNPDTGELITVVGRSAFSTTNFTGDFKAPLIQTIENLAFHGEGLIDGNMTGTFYAPNVEYIGANAFDNHALSGEFNAPKVTYIGSNAFQNAQFTGTPHMPKIKEVGYAAFEYSSFDVEG